MRYGYACIAALICTPKEPREPNLAHYAIKVQHVRAMQESIVTHPKCKAILLRTRWSAQPTRALLEAYIAPREQCELTTIMLNECVGPSLLWDFTCRRKFPICGIFPFNKISLRA